MWRRRSRASETSPSNRTPSEDADEVASADATENAVAGHATAWRRWSGRARLIVRGAAMALGQRVLDRAERQLAMQGQVVECGFGDNATKQTQDTFHSKVPPAYTVSSLFERSRWNQTLAAPLAEDPKEVVGRATWTLLHTIAAQYPDNPTRQQRRDATDLVRSEWANDGEVIYELDKALIPLSAMGAAQQLKIQQDNFAAFPLSSRRYIY